MGKGTDIYSGKQLACCHYFNERQLYGTQFIYSIVSSVHDAEIRHHNLDGTKRSLVAGSNVSGTALQICKLPARKLHLRSPVFQKTRFSVFRCPSITPPATAPPCAIVVPSGSRSGCGMTLPPPFGAPRRPTWATFSGCGFQTHSPLFRCSVSVRRH